MDTELNANRWTLDCEKLHQWSVLNGVVDFDHTMVSPEESRVLLALESRLLRLR